LVNQQHDNVSVRVIIDDRLGHLLQQYRFTGTRWRNDESPLSQADGCNDINNACTQFRWIGGQFQSIFWMQRSQVVEWYFFRYKIRVGPVNRLNSEEREVTFVFFRRTNL